ncbi:hypothetical protein [Stenotrophomonas sp. AB1(2024)]|uniref:hypothetical protein n=1 Tax=Stenotrophomonas sp. AB1(2024) TaxID=3132215 RepID=UPI0030A45028
MPVATAVPDALTPMLRHRLETSLPPQQRSLICNALNNLLHSVRNVPAVTQTPPPSDRTTDWPMAQHYLRLVAPVPGSQAGPFSADEQRTVHLLHYLHEVETATPLEVSADPAVQRPESQAHAHLRQELRREFGLLPCALPLTWRELAICDIAAKLLASALRLGFQPTEVRVVGAQELPPEAGRHQGGLRLNLAAWHAAVPPPALDASPDPNVWDPDNPLGNGLDLLRARLQMDWTGLTPLPRQ